LNYALPLLASRASCPMSPTRPSKPRTTSRRVRHSPSSCPICGRVEASCPRSFLSVAFLRPPFKVLVGAECSALVVGEHCSQSIASISILYKTSSQCEFMHLCIPISTDLNDHNVKERSVKNTSYFKSACGLLCAGLTSICLVIGYLQR
jgi:hypothetical protein